jgi:hypothetical protein
VVEQALFVVGLEGEGEGEAVDGRGVGGVKEGGDFDPVFFGREEEVGTVLFGGGEDVFEVGAGVGVVVGEPVGGGEVAGECAELLFEGVGVADAGEGGEFLVGEVGEVGEGVGFVRRSAEGRVGGGGVVDGSLLVVAVDRGGDFFELVGCGEVGAGEEDGVGSFEAREGLAEEASGEYAAVTEGVGGVDEDEVEVAGEPAVLEAVVEDEGGDFLVSAEEFLSAGVAVGLGDDGGVVVLGDELPEHLSFVGGLAGLGHVAAHEDGGVMAGAAEAVVEPEDDGGFSGAAGGDVADADVSP